MSRQSVIWTVIGLLFVGFIVVRTGQGRMGRIYVTPTVKAFERVQPEAVPWADQGSKAPDPVWRPIEPPENARDRSGVWQERDDAGHEVIGWTSWSTIDATAVFKARRAADGAGAATSGAAAPSGANGGAASPDESMEAAKRAELSWPRTIGLWLAAFFTLAVFSFLYRDNPFYKFTESVVVGASAAYYMVVAFWSVLIPKLFGSLVPGLVRAFVQPTLLDPGLSQRIAMALALVLGVMLLMQLVPKVRWMAVWPLAFVIGTFAGLKLFTYIESDLMAQLRAATAESPVVVVREIVPGIPLSQGEVIWQSFLASLKNSLLFLGTICTLVYFFFSLEHKGFTGRVARVGIWFLMITFGAAFGFTVMGRVTLLAKRFEFLFDDWLWFIDPRGVHQLVSTVIA